MTEHDDALSLDMVTAALRADSTDVAIYARVLAQSLGEALPADCVSVERDRSMSDRMRGRPGLPPVQIGRRPWMTRIRTITIATTRRMWMKPPIV